MKTKPIKKYIQAALAILVIFSGAIALMPARQAFAAPSSGNWIDQTHIEYNGQVFVDDKIDNTWQFFDKGGNATSVACNDKIVKFDGKGGNVLQNPTGADYYAGTMSGGGTIGPGAVADTGVCTYGSAQHITLGSVANSKTDLTWVDSGAISSVVGITFKQSSPGVFTYDSGGCSNTLNVSSNGSSSSPGAGTLTQSHPIGDDYPINGNHLWVTNPVDAPSQGLAGIKCDTSKPEKVAISNFANNASKKPNTGNNFQGDAPCQKGSATDANGNPCPAAAGSGTGSSSPDCGSNDSSLSWIICPVYKVVTSAADSLNGIITNLLEVKTDEIFTSGDCSKPSNSNEASSCAYYTAWSSMRNIALLFIVIAGLIMVIAQAAGSQAIDAYTVRKVLPRLLIAAIGIALSWILLKFFIDLSNALGEGIRTLIYSPFSGLNNSSAGGTPGGILGGLTIEPLLTGVAVVLAVGALLAFAGTIAIAVAIGLLVVVLRQILVAFLVIVAPIAIAMYVLPNTQKVATMWWDYFIKALLMFPIIVGFIAVGRVFSLVALTQSQTGGAEGGLLGIIAIVAYIIPYFLLPLTFKMAGGAMGGIAQGIHGAAQPMQKRLGKRRAEHWQQRTADTKKAMTSNRNSFTRGLGKVSAGVSAGGLTGAYGLNSRGRGNIERMRTAARDERMKEPGVQGAMQDDDVRMALMSSSQSGAKRSLKAQGYSDKKVSDIMGMANSIGFDSSSQLAAWQMEGGPGKGRALTKLAAANGVDDSTQMNNMVNQIARASGVDAERLRQDSMYSFGSNSRADLRQASVAEVLDDKVDAGMVRSATPTAINNMGVEMNNRLKSGSLDKKKQTAAQMLMTEEGRSGMSEPTRAAWTKQMEKAGIKYDSETPIEMQLARQVDPAAATGYDTAKSYLDTAQGAHRTAQQQVNDEVASSGTASAASMAALTTARADVTTANSYVKAHSDTLNGIATEMRATSSTYGSTTPRTVRDEV